jgi:hypothetical protein
MRVLQTCTVAEHIVPFEHAQLTSNRVSGAAVAAHNICKNRRNCLSQQHKCKLKSRGMINDANISAHVGFQQKQYTLVGHSDMSANRECLISAYHAHAMLAPPLLCQQAQSPSDLSLRYAALQCHHSAHNTCQCQPSMDEHHARIAIWHKRTNAHRMYDLKINQVLRYRFEESFFRFFPCQHSLCKPVQKTKKFVYH